MRNLEIQDGGPGWPPLKNDDVIPTSCDALSPFYERQTKQFSTYYLLTKSHCHSFNALEALKGGAESAPLSHPKAQGGKKTQAK